MPASQPVKVKNPPNLINHISVGTHSRICPVAACIHNNTCQELLADVSSQETMDLSGEYGNVHEENKFSSKMKFREVLSNHTLSTVRRSASAISNV